jgi:hypothetical protein
MNEMSKVLEELRLAIAHRMDEIIKEEIEAAQIRAGKRMQEAIPALSLEFAAWYTMQDLGTTISIRIEKKSAATDKGGRK